MLSSDSPGETRPTGEPAMASDESLTHRAFQIGIGLKAANAVLAMGPRMLVVKHGEYGATAFHSGTGHTVGARTFRAPALPLEEVVDPTGAGDSFAGGFFGYLASQKELTPGSFRRAMFYGSVMGSFAVERFGTERLEKLSRQEIDARFESFRELTHLD